MPTPIDLSDEDVAFLVTMLRNSAQPLTTQQLIDALRGRAASGAKEESGGG